MKTKELKHCTKRIENRDIYGGNKMTGQNEEPRGPLALYLAIPILSWAFYDFANTIFSSNINTVFFPFYTAR
jgi:hypothetical protein